VNKNKDAKMGKRERERDGYGMHYVCIRVNPKYLAFSTCDCREARSMVNDLGPLRND
jgi:hypothetical protein